MKIVVTGTPVVALLAASGAALAQPIVDGTRDGSYGAPIVVQTVQTQFGDGSPLFGSELDAAYARIQGGRLYLMFTGNLEANFNKLDIFIDSRAGGENTLSGTPQYDFGNTSQNMGGMTFDTGFEADFHMYGRWGGAGTPGPFEVDFFDRQGGVNAMVPGSAGVGGPQVGLVSSGSISAGSVAGGASGTALSQDLFFAINDNNTAGVMGGTGAADPVAAAAVTTGMEFSIALADLGNPMNGDVIRISAMINNGDHNYLSNQFLGGLPAGTGNLGGDGGGMFTGNLAGVNLNQFAGLQYFEIVVPAPGAAGLMGLAGLVALRRRR